MKNRKIRKIKLSALLIFVFIMIFSCSSDSNTDMDAQEILKSASSKLDTWSSFRFGLEHEKGITSLSNGLYQLKSVRGEVILPRRVKLETNAITFGQLIKLDVILIDGRSYWTNPINQKWSEIPEGQSPFGTFDVGEVILNILYEIWSAVFGKETIDWIINTFQPMGLSWILIFALNTINTFLWILNNIIGVFYG